MIRPRRPATDVPPTAKGASTLNIVVDDLSGPQIAAFLEEHVREMRAITPLESKYALVGCGALKRLDAEHAEVKSMRVAATHRRGGIASALLAHIIAEARRMGFTRLSLETGTAAFFEPARRLYQKFGFSACGPFADYQPSAHNTFMTRRL